MKKITFFLLLFLTFSLISCDEELSSPEIDEITVDNYPVIDGSTSTEPLNRIIACKLLGFNYSWQEPERMDDPWVLRTDMPDDFMMKKIKSSKTHNAFVNLIDKKVDIILSARKMSSDEKIYAEEKGVKLIEKPIALDALIFLCNRYNPVSNLSTRQIQNIYAGEIFNWVEVGGDYEYINPYVRNSNSGSQELMESIVMKDIKIANWAEQDPYLEISTMVGVYKAIDKDVAGLWYSVHYYKEFILKSNAKSLAVDGIHPTSETIRKKLYPFTCEVYAIIRSDIEHDTMTYTLFNYITSKEAKDIINESGYISIY